MKILIASDSYIYQTNGVANVVIVLAAGLRGLGHEVKVLAPSDGRSSHREGDDYFIRSYPSFFYPDVRLCPERHDLFLDELKQWKPDLIHLHTEASIARFARQIAAETHAPLIMTTHTDYAQFIFGRFQDALFVRLIAKAYGKRQYRRAEAVVVPSEKARGFAMVQAAGSRLWVIPNGIRLERFRRPVSAGEKAELFRKYGLEDNGCTLVMVTRVSKEKNIMEILRYFPALVREVPEAQLLIAGDGPDRGRLEKYAAKADLLNHVHFLGRIPPDEVYRYYAMGNLFVSASTFETQGLTYLEALACGLPMVCRDSPVLLNILENGVNGYTYQSEREFVDGVARILREKSLWREMREKALEISARFGAGPFVEKMLSLYNQVLGNAGLQDRQPNQMSMNMKNEHEA